jgi:leader peptidase (prepilin peptidase)/N-methyltransferase
MVPHLIYIVFLFALGACVGSFLNVVVWRLPRIEGDHDDSLLRSLARTFSGLAYPPSHCPKCNTKLAWYDNIPVFGWLALRGKCRYCGEPISPRYPIVEAACGGLFVFYYVMFFIAGIGPCPPQPVMITQDHVLRELPRPLIISLDWPIYLLDMFLIACLLAASLIDAELFIIPVEIPWLAAAVGVIAHACIDTPTTPGALSASQQTAALAAGGAIGWILSLALSRLGVIKPSFPKGEPLLEVDRAAMLEELKVARREGKAPEYERDLPPEYTRSQIRLEISKEMIFLLPPLILAMTAVLLVLNVPLIGTWWERVVAHHWISGALGAIFGALIGGFVVWLTRILGTIGFGRIAMGLGDVHLMFGVGAIIGAGAATVAFFLAPFFGILVALYMLLTGTRRELPYGPYLSLASAFVVLFYCPIAAKLAPGMQGLMAMIQQLFGGGGGGA